MKRTFKRIAMGVGALFFVAITYSCAVDPFMMCLRTRREILQILDNSTSVQVVEHSAYRPGDGKEDAYHEVIYSTLTLSPDQTVRLRSAFGFGLDYSGTVRTRCYFIPHHRIEFTQPDGTVRKMELCFTCGEMTMDDKPKRMFPVGWSSRLQKFISFIGMKPQGPWEEKP